MARRRRGYRLNGREIRRARALRDQGKAWRDIARELHTNHAHLMAALPSIYMTALSAQERRARIAELIVEGLEYGLTLKEIAEKRNLPYWTVGDVFRQYAENQPDLWVEFRYCKFTKTDDANVPLMIALYRELTGCGAVKAAQDLHVERHRSYRLVSEQILHKQQLVT